MELIFGRQFGTQIFDYIRNTKDKKHVIYGLDADLIIIGLNNLPDEQQDPMARWILEELQDEQKWDTAFANSLPQLEQLAKKALKEHQNK